MKDKFVQTLLSDKEYEQFMKNYRAALIAGTCINRSEYIRHMLGVSNNGNKPADALVPPALQDPTSQENKIISESDYQSKQSQLANDFAKLDI